MRSIEVAPGIFVVEHPVLPKGGDDKPQNASPKLFGCLSTARKRLRGNNRLQDEQKANVWIVSG